MLGMQRIIERLEVDRAEKTRQQQELGIEIEALEMAISAIRHRMNGDAPPTPEASISAPTPRVEDQNNPFQRGTTSFFVYDTMIGKPPMRVREVYEATKKIYRHLTLSAVQAALYSGDLHNKGFKKVDAGMFEAIA